MILNNSNNNLVQPPQPVRLSWPTKLPPPTTCPPLFFHHHHRLPSLVLAFQTWASSNLVLNVCGGNTHFCICSGKKPGLFTVVCYVLDKHQIEVVSAHVSSDFHRMFFMIQAHVSATSLCIFVFHFFPLQGLNFSVRSHACSRGERNILYKCMKISSY